MAAIPKDYVFACNVSDLPARGKKTIRVKGVPVLVVACESGIHAVENACPQTGRPIAHGKVLDCTITSPSNGARYDLVTGKYLGGGLSPFQSHWLRVFPTQIADGEVYVHMLHL
jgi:nitrite reductase/ring-hydroxylating ferredoxin subunit